MDPVRKGKHVRSILTSSSGLASPFRRKSRVVDVGVDISFAGLTGETRPAPAMCLGKSSLYASVHQRLVRHPCGCRHAYRVIAN